MNSYRVKASVDPVCGASLDSGRTLRTSVYQGKNYYFCSPACQKRFQEAPHKFIRRRGFLARFIDRLAETNKHEFGAKGPCCH